MAYGELNLPSFEASDRNLVTGKFLPGHTPHNKGKKWSDYLTKRKMKRCAKGWKNLETHRPKKRPDTAGRCRKATIAINDEGKWWYFSSLKDAAKWCGGSQCNVRRCCKDNASDTPSPSRKKINNDHKYLGFRFYYESDRKWEERIKP